MKQNGFSTTKYALYQELYKNVPKDTDLVLNTAYASIASWLSVHWKQHYFMLLCNELRDFSVFHMNDHNYQEAKEELIDLLASRGGVYHIAYNHENDYYEIWVKKDDGFHMYILFEYDWGVIEIGGNNDARSN